MTNQTTESAVRSDDTEGTGRKPKLKQIKPKTPEMAAYLELGYGMSLEQARAVIKEREANPATHPYEEYKKAQAFLAAYETKPIAIDKTPPWRSRKHR